jgi:hypothetical protein
MNKDKIIFYTLFSLYIVNGLVGLVIILFVKK